MLMKLLEVVPDLLLSSAFEIWPKQSPAGKNSYRASIPPLNMLIFKKAVVSEIILSELYQVKSIQITGSDSNV